MIGAQDRIDQLLVKKYANAKTVTENMNVSSLAVPPEKVLDIMNDYGQMQRMALAMKSKFNEQQRTAQFSRMQPVRNLA